MELISLREFARRVNVGEKTIRDGIKAGKLKRCITYKDLRPKVVYELGIKEFEESGLGLNAKVMKRSKNKPDPGKIEITENRTSTNKMTYAEALRLEKIYKAKLAKLEYEEKEGILVNKKDVYCELYEYGRELRTEFETIPFKVSYKLLNKTEITEISEILAKAIRDSLNKLIDNLDERKVLG